jgi:hypothetical protein
LNWPQISVTAFGSGSTTPLRMSMLRFFGAGCLEGDRTPMFTPPAKDADRR